MNNTRSNVIYMAISQGVNYILPLLIYPLLIRTLGIEKFGGVSLSIAVMQVLLLVVEYGFGYSATKLVAINHLDKNYTSQIFSKVKFARVILFIALIPLVFISLYVDSLRNIKELIFISLIAVFFNIFNPNWFLQGLGLMKVMALNSIISRGVVLVVVYIYVILLGKNNTAEITLILVLPYVIYSILSVSYLVARNFVSLYIPSIGDVIEVLKDGCYFFCSTVATSTYTMLTPIVLGIVSGNSAVGIFNSANMVKQALAGLIAPLIQAVYPKINIINKESPDKAYRLSIKFLKWIGSLFLIITIPLLFFPEQLSNIFFGDKGEQISNVLQLMSILPVLIVFNTIVGLLVLIPQGKNKIYFKIIVSGGGGCILTIYPMCEYFGVIGATISLLIAEIIVMIGMARYIIKFKNRELGR
ncbi:oligosaccharide flippase family protein [Citrobacter portucalensis]|uniref:oligosaccharide flippase family protein n=1 Tax=Citrobacter portucalensis TaxID=1639133 RepID=UPI00227890D1|nr:oligosaccharide flippase family protein [Citrobacter portucalensis]